MSGERRFERRRLEKREPLHAAWEAHAAQWIEWARVPGHDSYWRFHRDAFIDLVPPPGRLTLDVGCGEGRLSRDLNQRGHHVVGIDASASMVQAARDADPSIEVLVADMANLPFDDELADLAVAFMSLHDADDAASAIRELARTLEPGGRLCIAVVHPFQSAGEFTGNDADSPFVVSGSYFESYRYRDTIERDGLQMTFESEHRPIEWYFEQLAQAGFLVDRVREVVLPDEAVTHPSHRRWQRLPLFLHIRAVRP